MVGGGAVDRVVLVVCLRLSPRCLTWSRSGDGGLVGALRFEVPDASEGELGMELWKDIEEERSCEKARRIAVSERKWGVII